MIRKGLALTAAVLMSVCLGGCGGSSDGDVELREPVGEPGMPPGIIGAERSEEAGEPPADEN